MSCYCEIHPRKSHRGKNNILSNDYKSSIPFCKKFNKQIIKQFTNPPDLSNTGYKASINNSYEKTFNNCSQNIKNKHISLNIPKMLDSESNKMQNKNLKSFAVKNHPKESACSTCKHCSANQNQCTNGKQNSEAETELKSSMSSTEEAEPLNSWVPHTGCKYCHCHSNINEKTIKPNMSIPHTDCKYCSDIDNIEGVRETKCSVAHTDSRYCEDNMSNTNQIKSKNSLHHTDCKYCLNYIQEELTASKVSSTSRDSICWKDLSDELLYFHSIGNRYIPCLLHDRDVNIDRLYSHNTHCQMPHRKPVSHICRICEYPELCFVNNHNSCISDCLSDQCLQSIRELNIQDMKNAVKFTPCEFCLRNGENPVIYNSHQFRNTFGIITCPILRDNIYHGCEITENFERCLCNYEETVATINTSHPYTSAYHIGIPYKEAFNDCVSCSLLRLQNISSSALNSSLLSLEVPRSYAFQGKSKLQNNEFHSNFNKSSSLKEKYHDTIPFSKLSQKAKKDISCQFCLMTGKPPYIYNSHELRDKTGVNIKCPLLKDMCSTQQVE